MQFSSISTGYRATHGLTRNSTSPTRLWSARWALTSRHSLSGERSWLKIVSRVRGAQFTSDEFTKLLRDHRIAIGMDGRGRCHDNIFVERLWWTVKHEWVYL